MTGDLRINGDRLWQSPMEMARIGALAGGGCGRLIQAVKDIALAYGPDGVGTVGELHVSPNSRNPIPGEVRFAVDFRHPEALSLSAMDKALRDAAAENTAASVSLDMIWHNPPIKFDRRCVDVDETATRALGYPRRRMVSGAAHDACQVASKVPTAMVFVPCKDGLSHNEAEWAEPDHLAAGCNVMFLAAVALSRNFTLAAPQATSSGGTKKKTLSNS